MAKSALPFLLLAGGAAVVLTKKKKKRSTKKDRGTDLPGVGEIEADVIEEEELLEPEIEPEIVLPDPDDPEPEIEPAPPIKPKPTPIKPKPAPPDETPESDPRPAGPSASGSCVEGIYSRDPEYMDSAIGEVLTTEAATAWPDRDYHWYITRPYQVRLYNAVAGRFLKQVQEQEQRTLGPIVLRQELNKMNKTCDWFGSIDEKDEPTKLVWEDAKRIATLAARMTGFRDPAKWHLFKTGKRFTVTRESLAMPDPGFMGASEGLALNQRVELIVTQDETLENAEHLVGRVTKLDGPNGEPDQFEIRIVGVFQGHDVAPKLTKHHGFKFFNGNPPASSNAYFSKKGPTGIYRIYPKGME